MAKKGFEVFRFVYISIIIASILIVGILYYANSYYGYILYYGKPAVAKNDLNMTLQCEDANITLDKLNEKEISVIFYAPIKEACVGFCGNGKFDFVTNNENVFKKGIANGWYIKKISIKNRKGEAEAFRSCSVNRRTGTP